MPVGPMRRIFVGSCLDQNRPQPFWNAVFARQPDLALLIGDNVYADAASVDALAAHYRRQLARPGVQSLLASVPLLATWDDHDYGLDDAGADNPLRHQAKEIFLAAWDPDASEQRRGRDGVYDSVIIGPPGRAVHIILLDTRTFRSPLARDRTWVLPVRGRGPYVATEDEDATVLGEEQWDWLEEELRKPAAVRIIASSIQVLAQQHGWESWSNFPREQDRLMDEVEDAGDVPTIFVSGDRHLAELSRTTLPSGRVLYDLTTSSLNRPLPIHRPAANANRVGGALTSANFGEIEIDWDAPEPTVVLRVLDPNGVVRIEKRVAFAEM
ncbi:MAG TPA: alkaline phosphatase D family protein [Candidatus Limnocylindrales bacterium]|nr:alkaline phosphatase D family protein [Candidatus Limnocylindrales bacterium]